MLSHMRPKRMECNLITIGIASKNVYVKKLNGFENIKNTMNYNRNSIYNFKTTWVQLTPSGPKCVID
jgi:hypothetical protein